VEKEEVSAEQPKRQWAIAIAWLEQNNRSVAFLARGYLCPNCAKKLDARKKEGSPDALIATIQGCCSRTDGFINDRLPILESAFRLFLSNGNQPLYLEELGEQLSQRRGGDPYRTSAEALGRILKNDRYYGMQEITE
jgi:hypothetical protein